MAIEFAVDGRMSFWDALLLVTAGGHGCAFLLSEDMQDGVRFGGVTVLDPFVGDEMPESVAALIR